MPGNGRADIQAHAQPRGGDPQHRQLRVPGARQRVGQDLGQGEAVGLLALDLVVRGDRAQQDLHQEQRHHHPEVLGGGAHRRGDLDVGQRVALGHHGDHLVAVVDRVVPAEQADAGDQEQHAEHGPHQQVGRRRVTDQLVMRPVGGVGDVLAWPLGHRGPRRPPVEAGQQAAVLGIGHGVVAHGVRLAQPGGGRVGAEQVDVVRGDGADRGGAVGVDGDRAGGRVVGIRPQQVLHAPCVGGLGGRVQLLVAVHAVFALRPPVEDRLGLAVQPVRAPVRGDVAAVAPDRAQLLAADRLPHLAAGLDVLAGVDHAAVGADHPFGHRWRLAVDLAADPQQGGERGDEQDRQACPKLAGGIHGAVLSCGEWPHVRCAPRPAP